MWKAGYAKLSEQDERADEDDNEELFRIQERAPPPPTLAVNSTLGTDSSSSSSSSAMLSSSSIPPSVTQIAVFTAGGAAFTVTRISGEEALNGEVLTPGAPAQLVGDQYVSEGTSGVVYVGASSISFAPLYTIETTNVVVAPHRGSSTAGGSSSAAASSAMADAAPFRTAEAKIVAVVGAVVGAMIL